MELIGLAIFFTLFAVHAAKESIRRSRIARNRV